MGKILLLGDETDPHVVSVITALRKIGSDPLVLNRNRLPQSLLSIGKEEICIGGIDLRRIDTVWNRRSPPLLLPVEMQDRWKRWCEQEYEQALWGAFHRSNIKWINHPFANKKASYKPLQLAVASKVGFAIPPYLITSDAAKAASFIQGEGKSGIVAKPLGRPEVSGDGTVSTLFTNAIEGFTDGEFHSLSFAPVILQKKIRKLRELRVTVVGADIFAAEIDVQSVIDVDYRRADPYLLPHRPVCITPVLEQQCVEMLDFFGLEFAAIDFLIDANQDVWFLEINPNGQWMWIEEMTGLPISNAIATALVKASPN